MAEGSWTSLWNRVLGPSHRIRDVEQRTAAPLIAALMLATVATMTVGLALGELFWRRTMATTILRGWDVFALVVAVALIALAFALVRSGRYRAGLLVFLGATTAIPLVVPFLGSNVYEISVIAAGLIPVLVAGIVLSHRAVLVLAGLLVTAGMVELLLIPMPPLQATSGFELLLVVLVSGALVLVLRRHQAALERLRMQRLHLSEHAARRSERHYRTLFETVNDAIYLANRDGRLLEINGAACRDSGYTREELLGMSLPDMMPPDTAAHLGRTKDEVMRKGFVRIETSHRRKDGTVHPVELTVSATDLDGAPAFMGVARDLTERRRAEDERRRLEEQLAQAVKMESIGRLAGGVAHDFNNLLTAILGNIELAQRSADRGEPVRAELKEVREAAVSAAGLTRQLLAFSRRQILEPRLVDLNQLIGNMHKMLVHLIREDIELRTVTGPGLASVRVDPGLVEQVIVNLVVNGRDAMAGKGGLLVIETANVTLDEEYQRSHPLVEPGEYVQLSISDTGCGMSEEVKRHLFEPFFTTKPRGEGTGLGLATSYGAIRQSHGHVELYSELGKGTTFKIYLPAEKTAAEPLARPAPPSLSPGRGETILVVEDDERVRSMAARSLAQAGYQVLQASSGDGALLLVREPSPPLHLLVTDVVMPGMNGRQLAERLAAIQPAMRVLFTSGYSENIIAHHGVVEPGIHFLSKPYTPDGLARRVREVLDGGTDARPGSRARPERAC